MRSVSEFTNTSSIVSSTGARLFYSYQTPVAIITDDNRLLRAEKYDVQGTLTRSKTTERQISKLQSKHKTYETVNLDHDSFTKILSQFFKTVK